MKLLLGDCLVRLKEFPDNSVDSVVTDPPYGLSFMGKKWDYDVPSVAIWKEVLRVLKPGGHLLSFGGTRTYHRMVVNIEDAGFEIRDQLQWLYGSGFPKSLNVGKQLDNPEMEGMGTALKPANEPIVLARKPLSEATVAANVLKWGTGGLNIGACRIGTETISTHVGRFPANLILDETAAAMLDEQTGMLSKQGSPKLKDSVGKMYGGGTKDSSFFGDTGGASRFFYVAKASKSEKGKENTHPTVKPIKLMIYLIKLVTPPNGVVLDPFMGSGSTGVACVAEKVDFIGIEQSAEYLEIASKRIGVVPEIPKATNCKCGKPLGDQPEFCSARCARL
jgi:DNA modification methylase